MNEFGPWEVKELLDEWDESDDSCSFCGSLNPTTFMQRLEAGDIELVPTDKNYKVYVVNKEGSPFKQTYRIDHDMSGDKTKWIWTTRETSQVKFYFLHLNEEQKVRFIELLNEKKLKLAYPEYFYTTPYFITMIEKKKDE